MRNWLKSTANHRERDYKKAQESARILKTSRARFVGATGRRPKGTYNVQGQSGFSWECAFEIRVNQPAGPGRPSVAPEVIQSLISRTTIGMKLPNVPLFGSGKGSGLSEEPTHGRAFYWRRLADSNRRITVLQTVALPLG